MLQILFDSAVSAAELSLIAAGLSLTWGVTRFANIAHVQFAPVAAYLAFLASVQLHIGLSISVVLAVVVTGVFGVLLHRGFLRRLSARGSATALIGSLALSTVIVAVIQTVAGPDPQSLPIPITQGMVVRGAFLTRTELWIMVISAVTLAVFFACLRLSPPGRAIRGVAANPALAAASGVNSRLVTDLVCFLGAALGGLGGVLLALDTVVSLDMGADLLLPVFAAAVMGGVGKPGGAALAALLLAVVENLALHIDFGVLFGGHGYIPVNYEAAIGFVALILTMLLRPEGLFRTGGRRA